MNKVTLDNISLAAVNLDSLPRLKKIRADLLNTRPQICVERSKYITEYLKNNEHINESISIKRSHAINHFLANKKTLFFDDNLLAGTTSSHPFGAPVYPELSALLIWPELDTISTRKENPQKLDKKDKELLNLVPEVAEKLYGGSGTVPAVTLGGITPDGNDAVNDLTYIMLRVTEILKVRDPNVNARFHYKINSQTYRDRIARVIANTKAIPAIHNDVTDIKILINQGVNIKDARDYAIIGCVELSAAGKSYDASSSIMLNLASILELTLYNGKRPITGEKQIGPVTGSYSDFKSFSDFWEAFQKQFHYLAGQAIELNEMPGHTYSPGDLSHSFAICIFQGAY